jgi:hypothetical protein
VAEQEIEKQRSKTKPFANRVFGERLLSDSQLEWLNNRFALRIQTVLRNRQKIVTLT